MSVAFSPDGRQVLSGSMDKTLRLWDAASGQMLRSMEGNTAQVDSVAFSPDGRRAVSASAATLALWGVGDGRLMRRFAGHDVWISSVAFSPDGRRVLAGSHDEMLWLWDAGNGRLLRRFKADAWVNAVAFSQDGRRVLAGSDDNSLRLWNLGDGKLLRRFQGHTDQVYAVAFSPDGRQVLSGSKDKTVRLWDARDGRLLRSFEGHTDEVRSVAFSPDGKLIASASFDETIRIWRTDGSVPPPAAVAQQQDKSAAERERLAREAQERERLAAAEREKAAVLEHERTAAVEREKALALEVERRVAEELERLKRGREDLQRKREREELERERLAELERQKQNAQLRLGRRVALVIGNSAYKAVPRLPNPHRDADAIAAALRRAGFAEVTVAYDLAKPGLEGALMDFSERAQGADWAVVYYAGHGIEIGGQNFLIPVDAQLRQDRHVGLETVALHNVLEAAGGARQLRLVILDACRDNPFAAQMTRTVAGRNVGRGLARIEPAGGILVAYAARAGQIALDGDSGEHSPFAAALVRHLDEPGLEVGFLFRKVRDSVLAATGNRQEPFTYGSLPGEMLSFRPVK